MVACSALWHVIKLRQVRGHTLSIQPNQSAFDFIILEHGCALAHFVPALPDGIFKLVICVACYYVHYMAGGIRDSNLLNLACTVERMRCAVASRSRISTSRGQCDNRTMYFVSNISGAYGTVDVCRVTTNQRLLSTLRGGRAILFHKIYRDTRHFARQIHHYELSLRSL